MISIKHLEKAYADATPLKDINAQINNGDVISIIGPSGTGKSTLLRCINMLEVPTAGSIVVNGLEMTDKKTDILKVRQKLGMVFQSFNLFSHKLVIENVMMGPMDLLGASRQQAFDDAVRYLKMVGLGEKLYAYPDELSGGQKQRVAIARCLAMRPEIVLLDEPTSALDPTMIGEVEAVIRDLAEQGLTMMVVTHDMKFSREISNRVFYLDEGVVYEEGTPEQIFDHTQKEKTRAFVRRLRTWEYQITSVDFDLYAMNSGIELFAKRHFLSAKQILNTELIIEELLFNQIIKHTHNISIQIGFFEEDQKIEIRFTYPGEQFNPYEAEDEDILSMLLIRQMTTNIRYSYDGINTLKVDAELTKLRYCKGRHNDGEQK